MWFHWRGCGDLALNTAIEYSVMRREWTVIWMTLSLEQWRLTVDQIEFCNIMKGQEIIVHLEDICKLEFTTWEGWGSRYSHNIKKKVSGQTLESKWDQCGDGYLLLNMDMMDQWVCFCITLQHIFRDRKEKLACFLSLLLLTKVFVLKQ